MSAGVVMVIVGVYELRTERFRTWRDRRWGNGRWWGDRGKARTSRLPGRVRAALVVALGAIVLIRAFP